MRQQNRFCSAGGAVSAAIMAACGQGHGTQADGPADAIAIPAQCRERAIVTGIPTQYQRESIIEQPVLVDRAEPLYPAAPTQSRNFFCAAFSYSVDEKGRASHIDVLYDSHPGIDGVKFGRRARRALEQWRYRPGLVDKGARRFLGFTAVFYRGFGSAADIGHRQFEGGTASRAGDDIAEDWQAYGERVTQSQLDRLAAAEQDSRRHVEAAGRQPGALIPADEVHRQIVPPAPQRAPAQARSSVSRSASGEPAPEELVTGGSLPGPSAPIPPATGGQPTALIPMEDTDPVPLQGAPSPVPVLPAPASRVPVSPAPVSPASGPELQPAISPRTAGPPGTPLRSSPHARAAQSDLDLEMVPVTDAFAEVDDIVSWRK